MVRLFGKSKKKSNPDTSVDSSIINHTTMPSHSNQYDDFQYPDTLPNLKPKFDNNVSGDYHSDYQNNSLQNNLEHHDYDSKINYDSNHDTHVPSSSIINSSASTPWTRFKLANSPFPRYRHAASIIASDKHDIFLMGGLKEGSVFGDTWKISPKISQHHITGYEANVIDIVNMQTPPARVGHAAVLCGNAFIVYGGDTVDTDNDGFPDNNFYLFNINNHKYTIPSHILSKPNGRYGHTLGVVSLNNTSSRLYLFGGQLENQVYNDLYFFELNTFKSSKARWELVEPLNNFQPPPLTNHSMVTYKSKLYVFGGVYNNEKVSNDLWSFDALVNKWTQIPTTGAVPPPTNEHSSCIVNDKLYIYGGNDFSGVIYSSLYVLDLNTLIWSKLTLDGETDGPGPRCGHTMTFIPKYNKVLIMGGDKNDYVSDDPQDFDTYDTYLGNDSGTMLFELDVQIIDRFLSEKPVAAAKSPIKKVAASSKNNEIYQQHSKSLSGGPEEFASASNSPHIKTAPYDEEMPSIKHAFEQSSDVKPLRKSLDPLASSHLKEANIDTVVGENSAAVIGGGAAAAGVIGGGIAAAGVFASQNSHEPADEFQEPSNIENTLQRDVAPVTDLNNEDEDTLPLFRDTTTKRSTRALGNSSGPSDKLGSSEKSPVDEAEGQIAPASNGLTRTQTNPESVKQFISELTTELTTLRSTTKSQMQQASTRIKQLEEENRQIKESANSNEELVSLREQVKEQQDVIANLKAAVDPKDLEIDDDATGASASVPELGKYKLERMELKNKLLHLQQENSTLKQKHEEFEPFMNNQIGELSKFQKIIQSQEEKINTLSNQLLDQEVLSKDLNDWKLKHENLQLEFNNYKTIHEEDLISDDEDETAFAQPHSRDISGVNDNRSIISNARSKKEISGHLETLVNAWQARQVAKPTGESKDISDSGNNEQQKLVEQLQNQVDNLLKISKQNETESSSEINNLKHELEEKLSSLKAIEEKYNDALQSVNNTSKALKLNQEESESQKSLVEKLIKENNELKLFKKASKVGSRNATPTLEGDSRFPHTIPENDNEDDDAITNAHFNMKVKDLEADLYIVKQERDQLKQNVTNLQKQLYLAGQND